mgnify:CR=1 FL=1
MITAPAFAATARPAGVLVALDSTEHLLHAEKGLRVELLLEGALPDNLRAWQQPSNDDTVLLKLDGQGRTIEDVPVLGAIADSTAIEVALVGPLTSCRDESNSAAAAVITIAVRTT